MALGTVMTRGARVLLAATLAVAAAAAAQRTTEKNTPQPTQQIELRDAWMLQSSAKVTATGEAFSRPGASTEGWYKAQVPTTVFGALVADKVYPDPDYSMNLRQAQGESYKIGNNFSHEEMPADSPYRVSWWYRTEFHLPADWQGKTGWLNFRGINYRANIWLNGHRIASADQAQGTFRLFEFDVTAALLPRATNVLAIEVFPPGVRDLALTFVDWNPMPPDKDMGLWGRVYLTSSGPVAIRHPYVQTKLDLPSVATAHLAVSATVINASDVPQSGTLQGLIRLNPGQIRLSRRVELAPHASKEILFTSADTPGLDVANPRLWWPYAMGLPTLHDLDLIFSSGGNDSDRATLRFGIDEITMSKTETGGAQFSINGRRLLVRGGGWTPDMLLRDGPERWREDFRYVREMNLNTVRLEGKLMDDAFFDLADEQGILVMAGWCCCDHWEEWSGWKDNERGVATASLADQAARLRTHAGVLVWLNGSDNPPPAEIEKAYLDVLSSERWPKPILSSASGKPTTVSGASGVKMTGPYDYVPPVYWLTQTQAGGALGFNTETSPGAAIPPVESLRRFLPADRLWPIDDVWNYHAGGGQFLNLNRYNTALAQRYGPSNDLDDYVWKSQASAYEGERAMFEAFGRNKGQATGVIQWMLNNGWPSLIWHLYDYYLRPGGGYFGTKLANEPLHVQYSPSDRMVTVVNNHDRPYSGMEVTAVVYDLAGKELHRQQQRVAVDSDGVAQVFAVPDGIDWGATYFLRLQLENRTGQKLSASTYWLSSKPDVLDTANGTWFVTPESSYADFPSLATLPPATVRSDATFEPDKATAPGEGVAHVGVTNTSSGIAFLVRLRILRGDGGDEVLPVWWDDNYVTLLPGERRNLTARYRETDLNGTHPSVAVDGWNVGRHVGSATGGP